MRKYYLFNLKEDVYKYYYDKPNKLYKVFNDLYNNSFFSATLLLQILNNYKDITKYFNKVYYKRYGKMYLLKNKNEKTVVNFKKSVIIITSTKDIPNIFIILSKLLSNIFVIDFKNKDYFYLENIKDVYEIYKK